MTLRQRDDRKEAPRGEQHEYSAPGAASPMSPDSMGSISRHTSSKSRSIKNRLESTAPRSPLPVVAILFVLLVFLSVAASRYELKYVSEAIYSEDGKPRIWAGRGNKFSIRDGYVVPTDFSLSRARNMKLPTPVISVGFPKAGSTSVFSYFNCGGYASSHYTCKKMTPTPERTDKCGPCIENNLAHGRPPWSKCLQKLGRCGHQDDWCGPCVRDNVAAGRPPLDGCGDFDVYAEINYSYRETGKNGAFKIYLPQVDHLELLHEAYPQATFVLNYRAFDSWVKSVDKWFAMRERYVNSEIRGLPAGVGKKNLELRQFYEGHYRRVRQFVKDHPSHALVEVDIESDNAGKTMEEAFGIDAACWGQANSNAENNVSRPNRD